MQMVDTPSNFIEGIFVKELKNRFLCEVIIDGVSTVCYVPSSCHLSNFLDLKNKKVLLVPTQTPNSRTKYALLAVAYKRGYLVLNTSMANVAVANSLKSRRFSCLGRRKNYQTEHSIGNYKTDIYIQDSNTIIEIKSIISTQSKGCFPAVFSERSIKQLKQLRELMHNGYKVCFMIISLNPYLKSIEINRETEFYREFLKCINDGMNVKAYTCNLVGSKPVIKSCIPVSI